MHRFRLPPLHFEPWLSIFCSSGELSVWSKTLPLRLYPAHVGVSLRLYPATWEFRPGLCLPGRDSITWMRRSEMRLEMHVREVADPNGKLLRLEFSDYDLREQLAAVRQRVVKFCLEHKFPLLIECVDSIMFSLPAPSNPT